MDAFSRQLGTKQGRIKPALSSPVVGEFVFCLGFDEAGHFETFEIGDFAEISQSFTMPVGLKLVSVNVALRPPLAAMPVGTRWVCYLIVDNVVRAIHELRPGKYTRARKLSANVSKFEVGSTHTVAVRLQYRDAGDDLVSYVIARNDITSAEVVTAPTVIGNGLLTAVGSIASAESVSSPTISTTNLAPHITSLSTSYGAPTGKRSITINGTGFLPGAAVTIGGFAATSIVVVNSTKITCKSPAHALGVVDVLVTNTDTQNSGADGNGLFEYVNPATIFGANLVRWYGTRVTTTTISGATVVASWIDEAGNFDADATQGPYGVTDASRVPRASTFANGHTAIACGLAALGQSDQTTGFKASGAAVAPLFTANGCVAAIFRGGQNANGHALQMGGGPIIAQDGAQDTSPDFRLAAGSSGYSDGAVPMWFAVVNPDYGPALNTPAKTNGAEALDLTEHRIIGTYGGLTSKVYLDGVLQSTQGATSSDPATNRYVTMGARDYTTLSQAFIGLMGEVVIANVEPDATQRAQLDAYLQDCLS